MPGNLFSDGFDKFRYFFQLLVGIIQAGNNNLRYLDPDARLLIQPDRVEHGLEPSPADLFVKIFGKSFEVDVRCVEIRSDHLKGFGCDVPVRYEHILQSRIDCQARYIISEFEEDRGLGIGIGNTGALGGLRCGHDLFGADSFTEDTAAAVSRELRDVGILTVQAPEIAARCCDGIGQAAGEEMEERLLLYGVDVLRNELVVDEAVEHAALVLAHGADAAPSIGNKTAVATQAALHLLFFLRLLEQRLLHKVVFSINLLFPAPIVPRPSCFLRPSSIVPLPPATASRAFWRPFPSVSSSFFP